MTTTEQIVVRGLPPGTKAALTRLARAHSRSTEAEARALLTAAVPPSDITSLLDDLARLRREYDVDGDFELAPQHAPDPAVRFE